MFPNGWTRWLWKPKRTSQRNRLWQGGAHGGVGVAGEAAVREHGVAVAEPGHRLVVVVAVSVPARAEPERDVAQLEDIHREQMEAVTLTRVESLVKQLTA